MVERRGEGRPAQRCSAGNKVASRGGRGEDNDTIPTNTCISDIKASSKIKRVGLYRKSLYINNAFHFLTGGETPPWDEIEAAITNKQHGAIVGM